jgi:hypothetical protein
MKLELYCVVEITVQALQIGSATDIPSFGVACGIRTGLDYNFDGDRKFILIIILIQC